MIRKILMQVAEFLTYIFLWLISDLLFLVAGLFLLVTANWILFQSSLNTIQKGGIFALGLTATIIILYILAKHGKKMKRLGNNKR